ncbi:DUF421 domain-containing protein [Cupriavidus sp. KB_39]|uniref:DUF421 domain-containing protein n=1 Tax=Cupriavidus sp. KB_39 TaxID=3233036 RepID=UPI003F91C747
MDTSLAREAMQWAAAWFGQGEALTWWQMTFRAAVFFAAAWILLRGAGRRAFSQGTAFDLCIMLLLGAVLSRAVMGARPVSGTLAAALVLVLLHRVLGWLASRHPGFDRVIGGRRIDLLRAGTINVDAMRRAMISEEDLKGKPTRNPAARIPCGCRAHRRRAQRESDICKALTARDPKVFLAFGPFPQAPGLRL